MKQRDSFDKMTDSNEDIKPGQSDRDKKGIERQTLIVNSLYFFAIAVIMLVEYKSIFVFLSLIGIIVSMIVVTMTKIKTYEIRTKIMTCIIQLGVMICVLSMDDTISIYLYYVVMVVSIGIYGIPENILFTLISSILITVHHFLVIEDVVHMPGRIVPLHILQIVSIFAAQYTVFTWLKGRQQTQTKTGEIIGRLIKAEKSKDQFLATVSHEIRTPINTICGVSEILLDKKISPDMKNDILSIQLAGKNLLSVVNNILDFSELQGGRIKIHEEEYNIKDSINEIIEMAEAKKRNNNLEIIVDCDIKIPSVLYGDEKKIRRIIMSLVDNALKFTSEGFVRISLDSRKESYGVNLNITVTDSGIGISDEGIENIFNTFSQLDQGSTRVEGGIGLGLSITQKLVQTMGGIMTVKSEVGKGSSFRIALPQQIVDETPILMVKDANMHNVLIYINMEQFAMRAIRDEYKKVMEQIIVTSHVKCHMCRNISEVKRRTTFEEHTHIIISCYEYLEAPDFFDSNADKYLIICILFKYQDSFIRTNKIKRIYKPFYSATIIEAINNTFISERERQAFNMGRFIAPSGRVLVVDDNAMNIRVVKGLLDEYQIKVTQALSGRESLEKIVSRDYDFVLMDHMMPEMDGIEALRRIRGKEGDYYKNVPIIAFTANAVAGAQEMFINEGFADFIEKPVEKAVLERVLRRNLPPDKIIEVGDDYEPPVEVDDKTAGKTAGIENEDNNMELIDLNIGDTYCGGRKSLLEILEDYIERAKKEYDTMIDMMKNEDWKNYVIYVHSLKSFMASVGAMTLSAKAKEMEAAGKREDYTFIREHQTELNNLFEQVLRQIFVIVGKQWEALNGNGGICDANEEQKEQRKQEGLKEQKELREQKEQREQEGLKEQKEPKEQKEALHELSYEEFDKVCVEFENAVYLFDEAVMLAVIDRIEGCRYNNKPLKDLLQPIRKKIGHSDYMSAYETLSEIKSEWRPV